MKSTRSVLLLAALVIVMLPGTVSGRASAPPTPVAVTPLLDAAGVSPELVRWISLRLTELLAQAGFRVVPLEQTERTMRQMDLRPHDLIGLTRPVELATRLEAGAILTGRITRLDLEPGGTIPPPSVGQGEIEVEGPPEAFLTVELRLLEAPTRRVLFFTEVAGRGVGVFRVRAAAERALRDFLRQLQGALASR